MAKEPAKVRRLSSIHILSLLLGVVAAGWSRWPWTISLIGMCVVGTALAVVAAGEGNARARAASRSPRQARVRNVALALACAPGGAGWTGTVSTLALRAQLPPSWEGRELRVSGQVVSLPIVENRRTRFVLKVDAGEDQPRPLRGRQLQLAWYDDFDALAPGPRLALLAGAHWQLQVRLRAPRGLRNPGGLDAERNALTQRWTAVGQVRQPAVAWQTRAPHGWAAWRDRMSASIGNAIGGENARFIQALALGDTRGINAQDWRLLRSAGLTHLIAISGFHVGLVALAAAWLARGLWRASATLARRWPREHAAAVAALLAAALYGVVAGGSLPTVRTVLMIAALSAARLCRRPVTVMRSLALALLAVVLVDPLATLLPGFWLSFGGVACLATLISQNAARWRWLWGFLRAQWVATLCLLPVSAAWFAQASWVGPLANLFAIPWWSLVVVPLSLCGLALETLRAGAGAAVWRLAAACFEPSWRLFSWLGAQPFAQAPLTEVATAAAVLALLGAIGWLLPRGTPGKPLAAVLWLALAWPDTRRPGRGRSSWWCSTSARACRCWCAPIATPCCTTPGRGWRRASMPANGSWCQHCMRLASGPWMPWWSVMPTAIMPAVWRRSWPSCRWHAWLPRLMRKCRAPAPHRLPACAGRPGVGWRALSLPASAPRLSLSRQRIQLRVASGSRWPRGVVDRGHRPGDRATLVAAGARRPARRTGGGAPPWQRQLLQPGFRRGNRRSTGGLFQWLWQPLRSSAAGRPARVAARWRRSPGDRPQWRGEGLAGSGRPGRARAAALAGAPLGCRGTAARGCYPIGQQTSGRARRRI